MNEEQDQQQEVQTTAMTDQPPETEQEMQKRFLTDLVGGHVSLQEGQTYYLLAMHWWNSWKQWTGYIGREHGWRYDYYSDREKPKPGPIDNSTLLDESEGEDVVRKGKSDGYDFVIITQPVWNKLVEWFGGGPPIARPCIKQSSYHSSVIVEVRKLKLKIIWSKKPKECIERWFSKAASVGEFINTMANELHFDKAKIRVYDFHNAKKLKLLDKMEKHLDEAQILDGQYMLIEEQSKNGKWPNEKIYKSWAQNYSYTFRNPTPPGKTGLQNLGNTCFMNSGIQCLSLSVPIVDYFLKGEYQEEINESNPLGMKGEMAREYANLLKELWSSRTAVAIPREFKSVIGKYAPQFTGYAQHDSHELLAFLLDGLHEDLNRIRHKPYVQLKDSEGRDDDDVAKEAWQGYKQRNDSIIVDWFQGQLKSRLKCPVNGRVSNQFDPFMYLSVPIPVKSSRKIVITYYPMDVSDPPKKYGITIDKSASLWDFKVTTGDVIKVPPQSLVIVDVFCSRFHREFKNHEDVSDIKDNDVVAVYEVAYSNIDLPKHRRPKQPNDMDTVDEIPSKIRLYISVREEEHSHSGRSNSGIPFALSVDRNVTYRELYDQILAYMKARKHIDVPEDVTTDIFKLSAYNYSMSYSSTSKTYRDDNQPMGLSDKEPVLCELTMTNKKKYYSDPVDENVQIDPSAVHRIETSGKDVISLHECLSLFTTEEQLSSNDAWYCTECKEFREAYKKFDIWMAPKLLVVHLKRFSAVNRVWRERLDNLVDFPIDNFDMGDFVIGPQQHPPIYDLYAVSNHFGSMGGGHYTAFGRHRDDNKWYRYDDSSVSEASSSDIVSRAAYVLFYKRKDVEWPKFNTALDVGSRQESSSDDESEDDDMDVTPTTETTAAPDESMTATTSIISDNPGSTSDDVDPSAQL